MTLLQKVHRITTLRAAWAGLNRARKYSFGSDEVSISEFGSTLHVLEKNLRQIQKELRAGRYEFKPLRGYVLRTGNKDGRPLRISAVRDRVVLKALALTLTPIFVEHFQLDLGSNFAYLEGRGVRDAIQRVVGYFEGGLEVALKCDIKHFFESVDRERLLLEKVFPALGDDTSINTLIRSGLATEISDLTSFATESGNPFSSSEGIPQGNALSPLLANVYLAEFDNAMREKGLSMVRYVDDFVVLCRDKEAAMSAYNSASALLGNLRLELLKLGQIGGKTYIVNIKDNPVTFLSVSYNGVKLWPEKKKVEELIKKLENKAQKKGNDSVLALLTGLRATLIGWLASFSYLNDVERCYKPIDEALNRLVYASLKRLGWKLMHSHGRKTSSPFLSPSQRRSSGIPSAAEVVSALRNSEMKRRRQSPQISLSSGRDAAEASAIELSTPPSRDTTPAVVSLRVKRVTKKLG